MNQLKQLHSLVFVVILIFIVDFSSSSLSPHLRGSYRERDFPLNQFRSQTYPARLNPVHPKHGGVPSHVIQPKKPAAITEIVPPIAHNHQPRQEPSPTVSPTRRRPLDDKIDKALTDISTCQLSTMRLGSEIADVFNSLHPHRYDTSDRVYQDIMIKHLGFAPWIHEGINGTKKSITGTSTKELQERGGWRSHEGLDGQKHSNYDILTNKWIYMVGDSTTRQIWASYAASFQQKEEDGGNHFERNAKEWTRQNCQPQSHRKKHPPNGVYDEEGWRGACGVNEVTCHVSGYGEAGRLTFDWKHFPYEDYAWNQTHRPDLFTVQTGLHSCWHSYPEGPMSHHLKDVNQGILDKHKSDITKLMGAIRRAIDSNTIANSNPTTVIVLTSGVTGYGPNFGRVDACIQSMNRATSEAAMRYGFAVLDRGEIERRLMYQSSYSDNPYFKTDVHLIAPVQQLVASLLLHFYQCVDRKGLSKSETSPLVSSQYPLEKQEFFRNWNNEQTSSV